MKTGNFGACADSVYQALFLDFPRLPARQKEGPGDEASVGLASLAQLYSWPIYGVILAHALRVILGSHTLRKCIITIADSNDLPIILL